MIISDESDYFCIGSDRFSGWKGLSVLEVILLLNRKWFFYVGPSKWFFWLGSDYLLLFGSDSFMLEWIISAGSDFFYEQKLILPNWLFERIILCLNWLFLVGSDCFWVGWHYSVLEVIILSVQKNQILFTAVFWRKNHFQRR